jgi:hypothetical protein
MKIKSILAALLVLPSLAMSAGAQARTSENGAAPQTYATAGREVAAPSWSAACMTDQGPTHCGEPMWVYGSPAVLSRYHNPF